MNLRNWLYQSPSFESDQRHLKVQKMNRRAKKNWEKRRERHYTGPFQNKLHTPVLAVNISKITFLQIYHSQEMWAVWRILIPWQKWCWGSLLFAFSLATLALATPFMSTSSLVTSSLPALYSSWCCWCQLTSWPTLVVSSAQVSMGPTWRKCFLWTIWNSLLEHCFDVNRCEDTFHNNQTQEFYTDSCRAGRKDRCWRMFIIANNALCWCWWKGHLQIP